MAWGMDRPDIHASVTPTRTTDGEREPKSGSGQAIATTRTRCEGLSAVTVTFERQKARNGNVKQAVISTASGTPREGFAMFYLPAD